MSSMVEDKDLKLLIWEKEWLVILAEMTNWDQ